MAGGTGITPMLQVIDAVLDNKADKTKLSLVFANTTEKVRGPRGHVLCRRPVVGGPLDSSPRLCALIHHDMRW